MKGRQPGGAPPTISPHQMTPQELHEAQSPQDQFSPDHAENQQGGGKSGKERERKKGEALQNM